MPSSGYPNGILFISRSSRVYGENAGNRPICDLMLPAGTVAAQERKAYCNAEKEKAGSGAYRKNIYSVHGDCTGSVFSMQPPCRYLLFSINRAIYFHRRRTC